MLSSLFFESDGRVRAILEDSVAGPGRDRVQRRTFERLQRDHDAHVSAASVGMSAKLGLVQGRLGEISAGMDRWRSE